MKAIVTIMWCCIALGSSALSAQTVTTTGGATNSVPVFTGSAILGNSLITQSSGGVQIGNSTTPAPLTVWGNSLSSTSGSTNVLFSVNDLNADHEDLSITEIRNSAGDDWTTSTTRIQETTDVTSQGYIDFNPVNGNYGLAFGTTSGEAMRIVSSGDIGVGTAGPMGVLDVSGFDHGGLGGLVVSGANLDPNAGYSLTQLQNSGKLLEGWNRSQGGGEVDLVSNRFNGGIGGFSFYDYTNSGAMNFLATFMGNGNVGIGTPSPAYNLDVSGVTRAQSGIIYPDGNKQTIAWTGVLCGGDYAEAVKTKDELKNYNPGDVLVIASNDDGDVEKASEPYSTKVVGIYATKPGAIGRRQELGDSPDAVPMAMIGIVPAKVSAENGPIHKGDLLVTASIPGYAMKGTDRSRMLGAVIGKALGSLDSGTGVIETVVTLQ